jgi:ADP-ribose pyrophosphatase YjhB (NUDIX family)
MPHKHLSAVDERRHERRFRDAGLPKEWWNAFADHLRHCPRCAGRLAWTPVRAEGSRRFVCASCGTIAYQNPKIVAATLPVRDGKIYLLRRAIEPAHGRWTHPAGFMELGETVEEAAIRETREEIRARVRLVGPPRIYSYPDAAVVTVTYLAEVRGAAPRPGPESLVVRAFRPSDIPWEELAFRSTFHALRDWANGVIPVS